MLRLKNPDSNGLALPGSTPVTLVQIDSENLPYACHCPLCGGIFQIPEALLYKVEEDNLDDYANDAEFVETKGSTSTLSSGMGSSGERGMESSVNTGGEEGATTL